MADRLLKIIYILGSGRSGSTLLSSVLGRADGLVAPGEIGLIWDRIVTGSHVCDCGTPFEACAFWSEVLRNILPAGSERATALELNRLHWSLTGLGAAPRLLLRRSLEGRLNAEQRQYLDRLAQVYLEITRLSRRRVVVDASKRPLHASLLAALPSCEIRHIHLVRDSRAVVYSLLCRTRRSALYLAARWLIVNLLCEAVTRPQDTCLRLRYEDFCRDPQSSLARIASFTQESLEPIRVLPNRDVQLQPVHGVGGDVVRFRRGAVRISINEAWRTEMNAQDRRMVTRMTWPLLVRYGYRGRLRAGRGAV